MTEGTTVKQQSSAQRGTAREARKPGAGRAAPVRKPKELTPLDKMKLEIACELGLADKVKTEGWAMLTAAESGRLGGILGRRLRERNLTIGPKGTLVATQQAAVAAQHATLPAQQAN